jgi:hypothetical protein
MGYADEGRGMNLRWDPLDDRRYALRCENPSADPNKTMRGANRLAIEAFALLPTMPTGRRLATTAFQGSGARGTFITWPMWNVSLVAPVIASLLSNISGLTERSDLRSSLGVVAIYRSARITIGKFRNFTPSSPIGI